MRTRALLLATILAAAALGGCLGFGGGDGDTQTPDDQALDRQTQQETNETVNETDEEEEAPRLDVRWQNATVGGQDVPLLGWFCNPCEENEMTFNVTNETTAIVAQAFWESDVQLDVDLDVPPEPCETSPPTDTDCQPDEKTDTSPVEYRITDPTELHDGNWTFSIWPEDNLNEPAEVTMVVGVFEEEDVHRQWSKAP